MKYRQNMNKKGLLLCARYSVAPNFFGYCGPDKNSNLVDHIRENVGDREVESILSEFETLSLNLKLIAAENKIPDMFDERVVEAYWVGNSLLKHISSSSYAALLLEKFHLPVKLGEKGFRSVKGKILGYRLYPHHSFHVFNIFKRTGHDPSFHTLRTMDECRIGWGQVTEKNGGTTYSVRAIPLELHESKLRFGKPTIRMISIDYREKKIIREPRIGEWVSFHWGRICDIISEHQARQLSFYTRQAAAFFNAPEL